MATASAEAAPAVPALAAVDSPRAVALSAPVRRAPLGQGSSRALLRPCPRVRCGALRLVSSLARAGSRCAAGRPRLLALGHALASSESARCPQSPPSLRSGSPLSLPSRGVRAQRATPFAPLRTKRHPVRKREGAAAAAAAAQLRRSISPPGKVSVHWRRSCERFPTPFGRRRLPVGICL